MTPSSGRTDVGCVVSLWIVAKVWMDTMDSEDMGLALSVDSPNGIEYHKF